MQCVYTINFHHIRVTNHVTHEGRGLRTITGLHAISHRPSNHEDPTHNLDGGEGGQKLCCTEVIFICQRIMNYESQVLYLRLSDYKWNGLAQASYGLCTPICAVRFPFLNRLPLYARKLLGWVYSSYLYRQSIIQKIMHFITLVLNKLKIKVVYRNVLPPS